MKKIIFLIISSSNLEIYSVMKNITSQCLNKAKCQYNIEYFFVESVDLDTDLMIKNDTIYVNCKESLETILEKTHKALIYINNNYDYDIIIRTNISSFWNIKNLYELVEDLDENNIAMGYVLYWDRVFIYGTGIIMSRDLCEKVCECNLIGEPDDVLLSQHLLRYGPLKHLPDNHQMYRLESNENSIIPDDISNILYFRIKSSENRFENDSRLFKALAKKIYDIDTN
jgi:hypothetical protein